jgi:hypothetical protein
MSWSISRVVSGPIRDPNDSTSDQRWEAQVTLRAIRYALTTIAADAPVNDRILE